MMSVALLIVTLALSIAVVIGGLLALALEPQFDALEIEDARLPDVRVLSRDEWGFRWVE